MRRTRQLSSRILISVVAILTVTTAVGFVLVVLDQRSALDHKYQERALGIADTFAALPSIREAMVRRTRADRELVRTLAAEVRSYSGASYIVVIDPTGVRYSHPNPALIGQRVTERVVALDGRPHLDLDQIGNLGVSARARVPIWAPAGPGGDGVRRVVGEVSAGIEETRFSGQLLGELPTLALYFACALGLGVVASITLARRLKRTTFGLELDEIAALVQEREAMLHEIREGVITLDRSGRVTLINDEARRLIPLGNTVIGEPLAELVSEGRLRDLLIGSLPGQDQVVVTDEHILVVSRMPVFRDGRELGAVITLRDRTELEALLRELDTVDALTNALRAQQHEFANRMHTLAGLIGLGDHEAAARYALDVSSSSGGLAEDLRARIERPEIAAMLLAKTTIAAERGVKLVLTDESRLADGAVDTNTLLTIVGNLIDNAIDAAVSGPRPAEVTVGLSASEHAVAITVSDSGPGIPRGLAEQIFADGYTTKPAEGQRHRGLGLALVHRLVHRAQGTISVQGSTFTVRLPAAARADTVEVSA